MKALTYYFKKYDFQPKRLMLYIVITAPLSYFGTIAFYMLQTECADDLPELIPRDVSKMTPAELDGYEVWFDEELNQWCMFEIQI
ncbi:hypothetical protein [Shewanella frigidimarina]|uniref:hypothetical protein n=1 Tax=Shewanella frigidimarina TaxID=56812 RepID=UPI003D7941C6